MYDLGLTRMFFVSESINNMAQFLPIFSILVYEFLTCSEEQVNCATHDKGLKCQVWTMKNGPMNGEE